MKELEGNFINNARVKEMINERSVEKLKSAKADKEVKVENVRKIKEATEKLWKRA